MGHRAEKGLQEEQGASVSLPVLVHFDGGKHLFLACDASPLLSPLAEERPVPILAAERIQR